MSILIFVILLGDMLFFSGMLLFNLLWYVVGVYLLFPPPFKFGFTFGKGKRSKDV